MEDLDYSVPVVIAVMVLFHMFGGVYVYRQKFTKAVFERSKAVLIMSNLFNVLEITFNLVFGSCLESKYCSSSNKLGLVLASILLSNCFYMTNLLRLNRIIILADLESGKFSSITYQWSKLQLTWKWNIFLISFGSAFLSFPYSTYILYKYNNTPQIIHDVRTYALFAGILISIECFVFFLFLVRLFLRNVHPTMRIEYIFQLVLWGSALFVLDNSAEQRVFYLVPIRNFIMMLVTIAAVYEGNSYFKPPLPPDVDLQFVLQNQELYHAFKSFLSAKRMYEGEEMLNVLLGLRIMKENPSKINLKILKNKIHENTIIPQYMKDNFLKSSKQFENENFGDQLVNLDSYCYNVINTHAYNEFKTSDEMLEAQVNYSVF